MENKFIYSQDKKTIEFLKQKFEVLFEDNDGCYFLNDISNVDFWMTMWGINNDIDHGLPIAPLHWYKNKKISIQCSPASTIDYLRDKGMLKTAPDILKKINGDENPIVILYHLKC